ncbi:hypothetical protein GCM10027053_09830 [Intrasporangium mesophilum]
MRRLPRLLAALALGGLVVSSNGCGSSDSSGGVSQSDVTLRYTVSVGFSQFPADPGVRRKPGTVIDYSVTNTGTRQLVVYDRIPDMLGSATLPPDLNPEHGWVYMSGGVVRLSRQGFATAPAVRFVAAPVIGARALEPGATVTGRTYAVTPPTLDVPGPDFVAPRDPIDPAATRLQLCLQVGERTAQMRPSPALPGVLEAPVVAPGPGDLVCGTPA